MVLPNTRYRTQKKYVQIDAEWWHTNPANGLTKPAMTYSNGITIAAIWPSGLTNSNLFGADTENLMKFENSGGEASGLIGNGGFWVEVRRTAQQGRNRGAITMRGGEFGRINMNGSTVDNLGSWPVFNGQVRVYLGGLLSVAVWERSMSQAEMQVAINQLDSVTP